MFLSQLAWFNLYLVAHNFKLMRLFFTLYSLKEKNSYKTNLRYYQTKHSYHNS